MALDNRDTDRPEDVKMWGPGPDAGCLNGCMAIVRKKKWISFWWRQGAQRAESKHQGNRCPRKISGSAKEELSNNESTESGVTVPSGLSGPRRWLGVRGISAPHKGSA